MEVATVTRQAVRRYTSKQITEHIRQWRRSGLSKKAFCETSSINYYTFVGWTAPKKKRNAAHAPASGFIPVKVKEISASPFAEVYYANGSRILLCEAVGAKYLRAMIK
jgi:hypothetical protein